MKTVGGLSTVTALSGCLGQLQNNQSGQESPADEGGTNWNLDLAYPSNSILAAFVLFGKQQGIFEEHGITLNPEIVPYRKVSSMFPAREIRVSTIGLLQVVKLINRGTKVKAIAGTLPLMNPLIVRKGSDIRTLSDAKSQDATLAHWSWGAGTVQLWQVYGQKRGFDLQNDFNWETSAPPSLGGLLKQGEVDGILNITTLAAANLADEDLITGVDIIKQTREMSGSKWIQSPLVAYQDWIDEDTERADAYISAWKESMRAVRSNSEAVLRQFADVLGAESEGSQAIAKQWLDDGYLTDIEWTDDYLDIAYDNVKTAKEIGLVEEVPDFEEIFYLPD